MSISAGTPFCQYNVVVLEIYDYTFTAASVLQDGAPKLHVRGTETDVKNAKKTVTAFRVWFTRIVLKPYKGHP